MKPLVAIHRVGPDAYAYSISTNGAHGDEGQASGNAFASLEGCILDAGESLGQYFHRVEVKFEQMFLGSCATAALRMQPKAVAQRLAQHFQPA